MRTPRALPNARRRSRPRAATQRFDWLRIAALVAAFAALTYAGITRYTGRSPGEPYREPLAAFFAAARARDSLRLRTMVGAEGPLRWALAAAARVPSPIPRADDRVDIQGVEQTGDTIAMLAWASTGCGRQPFFLTLVNRAGRFRVVDLRTDCDSTSIPLGGARIVGKRLLGGFGIFDQTSAMRYHGRDHCRCRDDEEGA